MLNNKAPLTPTMSSFSVLTKKSSCTSHGF